MSLAVSFASRTLASPLLDELPEPTAAPDLAETLLLDTQVPAVLDQGVWAMAEPKEKGEENGFWRRASAQSTVTTTFAITISTATAASTASDSDDSSSGSSASATSSTATTTTTAAQSALPSPFDGGLSNNFTSTTCPTFINNMLADPEFQACYPVSLLIQSSQSFFEAEKSLVSISRVLDHACQANATRCASYLADMAENLTSSANCGADYEAGVPTATEAYLGLVSYPVLYGATCLRDAGTGAYCFGAAVTNQTNPTATYVYYLPLNTSLPGGAVPVCGACLRDTMALYQVATANRAQPIAYTYGPAARQVDVLCGPAFANQTLASEIVPSAAAARHPGAWSSSSSPSAWLLPLCFLLAVAANWLL